MRNQRRSDMADEVIEATLAQFREVNLYQIPPRSGAGGHKSGTFCKHAACYRARPSKTPTRTPRAMTRERQPSFDMGEIVCA